MGRGTQSVSTISLRARNVATRRLKSGRLFLLLSSVRKIRANQRTRFNSCGTDKNLNRRARAVAAGFIIHTRHGPPPCPLLDSTSRAQSKNASYDYEQYSNMHVCISTYTKKKKNAVAHNWLAHTRSYKRERKEERKKEKKDNSGW